MNIELTDKEKEFLLTFAQRQDGDAQDNVGTVTPIHLVERKCEEFVEDDSMEVWIDDDFGCDCYKSLNELIDARNDNEESDECLPQYEDVEWTRVNGTFIDSETSYCEAFGISARSGRIIVSYKPAAFFFILEEARRYRDEYQSHNCGGYRIYTYGLGYDNRGDMPVFRALLMRMGQQLIEEDNP